jgi:hypothetical protein
MNRKRLSGGGYRKISQEKAQKLEDVIFKTEKINDFFLNSKPETGVNLTDLGKILFENKNF